MECKNWQNYYAVARVQAQYVSQ